jgi:hypothetical protein
MEKMTLHEELVILNQAVELENQGKADEAMRLTMTIPLDPWLAKNYKDWVGADALRQSGWNLSAAEEEYGKDWLSQ